MSADLRERGRHVATFYSDVVNLSRLHVLHDLIFKMYESGEWRDYEIAGRTRVRWRACEFDYFLISMNIKRNDAQEVFARPRADRHTIAEAMQSDDPRKRRPLDVAAAGVSTTIVPGGLTEAAQRLGWIDTQGKVRTAVPRRARTRALTGESVDEQARKSRRKRVADRRAVLDRLVAAIRKRCTDPTELRYVIDELHRTLGLGRGRLGDRAQWRRDVERFNGDTTKLAALWRVAVRTARYRTRQCVGD